MILVTGGSGYVGSHVVRRLVDAGRRVRALVRNPDRARGEGRLAGLDVEWAQGDVTQPETLASAMAGATAVVHTVAIAIEKGSGRYEQVNAQGTLNVVQAARRAGVRRLIHMSQLGSDPNVPYRFLASKGQAQEHVTRSDLAWTVFRPSVIWGPEDEFANTFAKLVPLTPIVFPIVGDGRARFQPVWVEDVVTCIVQALDDSSTIGLIAELGGPEVLTLEDIERRTLQALGARRWMIRTPVALLRPAVLALEILLPAPPVTRSLLELLAVDNTPRDNRLQRFVPTPRPFTPENVAEYMRRFTVRGTVRQFFNRPGG